MHNRNIVLFALWRMIKYAIGNVMRKLEISKEVGRKGQRMGIERVQERCR